MHNSYADIPRHPRSQRFTLIELLVVVAIISVLASMLLPSLARARAYAQSTLCLNNQKGMAMAGIMYADDELGWLPNTGRFTCEWMIKMSPYVGERKDNLHKQVTRATSPEKQYDIFRCPTNFEKPRGVYYYGTYGYNLPLTSQTAGGSNTTNPNSSTYIYKYVRRLDAIDRTDATLMMGDCYIINAGGFGNYTSSANPALEARYNRYHQGFTLNMGFCDGSAANLSRGERNDLSMGVSRWGEIKGWY